MVEPGNREHTDRQLGFQIPEKSKQDYFARVAVVLLLIMTAWGNAAGTAHRR